MHGNLKKKKNQNQILFTNFNKYVSQKTKKKKKKKNLQQQILQTSKPHLS